MDMKVRKSTGRLKRDVSKKPARQMTIAEKFFRRSRGEKMWKLDE